ncbi:MAG: 4-hydroxy-tetrahydrodipicolinate reductase [Sedimentisphaerales bacterium]|jgi:4-hydroxy-tetrahydrodipicolinate reductase
MKPKLIICGAAGRMGRRIVALAVEEGVFEIAGAVEKTGHPDLGKDAGALAGVAQLNVKVADGFPAKADIVIDFSLPEAADKSIDYCSGSKAGLVLGTTGLSEGQRKKIETASSKVPIVCATNMSVGMNTLFAVVGKVASMLGPDYDVEIVEQHHRFKKDAPSGSALTLAENIAKATDKEFPDCLACGRNGKDALREKDTIGMHAVRAGDIVGIHSVIFSTLGETVTLNHTAHSRDTFVRGALRAASWLIGKKPGLYSMADALGLK